MDFAYAFKAYQIDYLRQEDPTCWLYMNEYIISLNLLSHKGWAVLSLGMLFCRKSRTVVWFSRNKFVKYLFSYFL